MELRTARLRLRQWRESDLPAFAAMNDDPRVMEFMPRHLTREESDAMAGRIQARIGDAGWGLWAVEVAEIPTFIGFVGLSAPRFAAHFTPCIEVGWRLAFDRWGHGYATEAARAAMAYGFDVLRLSEIVSFAGTGNFRSHAVMERLGMRRDPADDFDHPTLPDNHPIRRQVLYRKSAVSR